MNSIEYFKVLKNSHLWGVFRRIWSAARWNDLYSIILPKKQGMYFKQYVCFHDINPFVPKALFLYLPETSENLIWLTIWLSE